MGYYAQAAICKNGHVETEDTSFYSGGRFCKKCGEEIINSCPNCGTAIQGEYYEPGVIGILPYTPPSYCHNCGKPYPWTMARIEAAKMLIEDTDELWGYLREIQTGVHLRHRSQAHVRYSLGNEGVHTGAELP